MIRNTWLWFHILGGGILAKLFMAFFGRIAKKYDRRHLAVIAVFLFAVAWEIFEYTFFGLGAYGGDLKRFIIDALQDIAGAVIMAIVVAI